MVFFSIVNALAHITLSGNYPVDQFAGNQAFTSCCACAEGDGTAARLWAVKGPAIADATGDTVLIPAQSCNRLALVQTNSPFTVTWKVGTGNSADATAAGYGTSAPIHSPSTVTSWRNRFYASDASNLPDTSIVVVYPAANWQQVIISSGSTPAATANDIPFDNTYHSDQFAFQGGLSTWSNCWLQLFQHFTQVGHIVDPEGGNMFLLAGIAGNAFFASADLNGNVWVSGHAGNAKDLGKHSIAYTGCPAMSPHKCKWQTATATVAPMTTAAATTPAVGTTAAATSAAATSSSATTAVVGTTAAATSAAVTTTVATSTTAAAGSASSSSGSTGNGASSVTVAALGLMTMVLAMF